MPKQTNTHLQNSRFSFFREFLQNPAQIGSVIPSSRSMERRIVRAARITSAKMVVELGPGTGGTTRALLKAMPKDAILLTVELNPELQKLVKRIEDPRHISCLGSAGDLAGILAHYAMDPPDAVVSGIPFSTMNRDLGTQILEQISEVLAPSGYLVAYQFNPRVAQLGRPIMGEPRTSMEFFNIPPMCVYQWEKGQKSSGPK